MSIREQWMRWPASSVGSKIIFFGWQINQTHVIITAKEVQYVFSVDIHMSCIQVLLGISIRRLGNLIDQVVGKKKIGHRGSIEWETIWQLEFGLKLLRNPHLEIEHRSMLITPWNMPYIRCLWGVFCHGLSVF